MLPTITHIGVAVPAFAHPQDSIKKFMQNLVPEPTDKRVVSLMYAQSKIQTRHSVIPDYGSEPEGRTFYPQSADLEPFPSTVCRMQKFEEAAFPLAVEAIESSVPADKLSQITHLITVSCTGLSAPGLDIQLIQNLGLSHSVQRLQVNFMGCFAAITALRQAHAAVVADPSAKVLVVLVELCTLHFQKENTLDYHLSNLLFSDGAAAMVVEATPEGLGIKGFHSEVFPENAHSMAWNLGPHGFLMKLTMEVPDLIENNMGAFMARALEKHQLAGPVQWAIHPGGRKILEATAKALNIGSEDLRESYEVLKNYGNMSSCTLVFVLKLLLEKGEKTPIVGAAFGPGITMESILIQPQ